jgi:hypothetical protein
MYVIQHVDTFKTLCKYGFPQPLVNETHFNIETRLSHIKRTYKWLNNANPWILLVSRCNHDLKFITTSGKDNKSLIYYITYYITKTFIYISHMYYILQIVVQNFLKITEIPNNNYDLINKS